MRWHRRLGVVLGVVLVSASGVARAHAASQPPYGADDEIAGEQPVLREDESDAYDYDVGEARRVRHGFEVQGILTGALLPKLFGGADAAWTVGGRTFQLRLGGSYIASGPMSVGVATVRNAIVAGFADLCAGKSASGHRVRVCIGGEAGTWRHRWSADDFGRGATPHVAGTIKSDYRIPLGRKLGLLIGASVMVPAIGPTFHGRDAHGVIVPMVFPGPIAGTLRAGLSWGG